jgi:hypothetical protein
MDWSFWAGIVLGGLVGLPVTIIGNLYSDQVRDYLERRKMLRLNNMRSKELRIHGRLLNLINGDPREVLALAETRTFIVVALVTMFGSYATVFLFLLLTNIPAIATDTPRFVSIALVGIFILFGILGSLMGLVLLNDFRNTMRKIRRFGEYEDQIREKWGHDAI